MPSKGFKRICYSCQCHEESANGFSFCDFVILLSIFSIFTYISYGAYGEIAQLVEVKAERSVHCLKEFHDTNCNPYNLTLTCEGLN